MLNDLQIETWVILLILFIGLFIFSLINKLYFSSASISTKIIVVIFLLSAPPIGIIMWFALPKK